MAFKYFDRIKEVSTATGIGNLALGGAVSQFQAFSSRYSNGDTFDYCIADQSGSNWEAGIGTYNSSGNTISRTIVKESTNNNLTVNFTSGALYIFTVFSAYRATNALPGGASTNVQSNNGSGGFSGDSGFTYAGSNGAVAIASTNFNVGGASMVWPSSNSSGNLINDGSGNLSWHISALPGGSAFDVQVNYPAGTFHGDSGLTYVPINASPFFNLFATLCLNVPQGTTGNTFTLGYTPSLANGLFTGYNNDYDLVSIYFSDDGTSGVNGQMILVGNSENNLTGFQANGSGTNAAPWILPAVEQFGVWRSDGSYNIDIVAWPNDSAGSITWCDGIGGLQSNDAALRIDTATDDLTLGSGGSYIVTTGNVNVQAGNVNVQAGNYLCQGYTGATGALVDSLTGANININGSAALVTGGIIHT